MGRWVFVLDQVFWGSQDVTLQTHEVLSFGICCQRTNSSSMQRIAHDIVLALLKLDIPCCLELFKTHSAACELRKLGTLGTADVSV
jgi:hypothetical protein